MKRFVGIVDICGLDFTVWDADPKGHPPIESNHGVCYPAKQEIYLDATMTSGFWMHTLMHEALHGIWAHTNVSNMKPGTEDYEENVIRAIVPPLMQFLKSLSNLRVKK